MTASYRCSMTLRATSTVHLHTAMQRAEKTRPDCQASAGTRVNHQYNSFSWARQGSNLRPRDYESPALTTELRARRLILVERTWSGCVQVVVTITSERCRSAADRSKRTTRDPMWSAALGGPVAERSRSRGRPPVAGGGCRRRDRRTWTSRISSLSLPMRHRRRHGS